LPTKITKPNCKYRKASKILLYAKAAFKMLVKLTPGVDFTNILHADFVPMIPSVQKDSQVITVFLRFWDLCAK